MARSRQRGRELELLATVLTTAQVCGRLEVSESTLRRLVSAGLLVRARRIGNADVYFADQVEELARSRRSAAALMEDATR